MKGKTSINKTIFSYASPHGQGIVAAPKAYFAKQSMERKRNCEKPGFCHGQKWPQKKEPKFSSVKWAKSSCEEGEEIELSASVEDITDENMVTLQVFPEGKEYTSKEALLFVKIRELRK